MLLRIRIHAVCLAQFRQHHQRSQRIQVIVQRHAGAIQLARQRAIGPDVAHPNLVSVQAPAEIGLVLDRNSCRRHGESRPVAMVVPRVAVGVAALPLNVVARTVGQAAQPFLDRLVLVRSAHTAVPHLQVCHCYAGQQPLLLIASLARGHCG